MSANERQTTGERAQQADDQWPDGNALLSASYQAFVALGGWGPSDAAGLEQYARWVNEPISGAYDSGKAWWFHRGFIHGTDNAADEQQHDIGG